VEPGADEELPQPRRHRDLARAQRLRVDLGIGALGLVLAATVGSALAHHANSSSAARSAPASLSTSRAAAPAPLPPIASDFVTVSAVPGGWLPRPPRPFNCPYETHCVTVAEVPQQVREAVRDAFAGATITFARTMRLYIKNVGNALTALDMTARRGGERITLRLRSIVQTRRGAGGGATAVPVIFNGRRILQYQTRLGRYSVIVQVVAPATERVRLAPLVHLATDIRLLNPY
jgi:hypothetical protein